jgi:hypothetical protein
LLRIHATYFEGVIGQADRPNFAWFR